MKRRAIIMTMFAGAMLYALCVYAGSPSDRVENAPSPLRWNGTGYTLDQPLAMYTTRVEKTTNATLTSQECMNTIIANRGSVEINLTLPAFSCSSTIRVVDEKAYRIELNPPAGEALELDGSLLSGVSVIRSPGVVGSKIVGTRMKSESGTTWFWSFDTVRGAYDGTGVSD